MNKKTKLLSILGLVTAILFLFSSEVLAQSLSISGKVIDKNSQEPVIGASVLIEGTSNGTITDLDGNFMLSNVPSKGNLVVSYICLLYTSPSPRDRTRSRMPSSA